MLNMEILDDIGAMACSGHMRNTRENRPGKFWIFNYVKKGPGFSVTYGISCLSKYQRAEAQGNARVCDDGIDQYISIIPDKKDPGCVSAAQLLKDDYRDGFEERGVLRENLTHLGKLFRDLSDLAEPSEKEACVPSSDDVAKALSTGLAGGL